MTHQENPLNQLQRRIIETLRGALLVLAPVGTGKTRVLAERVVYAVQQGVVPNQVLCLTFTNRAANAMRERLFRHCPNAARQATVKTFHALCAHMLRVEARSIGVPVDFVICDDEDSEELVKEVFSVKPGRDAQNILADISRCKVDSSQPASLDCDWHQLFAQLGSPLAHRACQYQNMLAQLHALDFSDLVYYSRAMLRERADIRRRWEGRFSFIQVDEIQDTHMTEYEIVRTLARPTGNVALIGDLDQTIYGWRGSEPEKVINAFRREFSPRDFSLVDNYRATRTLLGAADSFANSFRVRTTAITPAPTCPPGHPIHVHHASTEDREAAWIGNQIRELARGQPDFRFDQIAVLTRTNRRSSHISSVLQAHFSDIPHVTVDQYEFFRRQEVKDALAYLRLLTNPHDTSSMLRVVLRPRRGIGDATLATILNDGENCGLRLTDMIQPHTLIDGEPFAALFEAFNAGDIVIFDVETTGLSVSDDEVIEIAATRLTRSSPNGDFHVYLRNSVPVGDSQHIHGFSDAFLASHGQAAPQAFRDFFRFADGALLVGHNVGYDVKMVAAHARRLGLNVPLLTTADTWDLAKRFVQATNNRLETLARELHLPTLPTHRGTDDVQTTLQLFMHLIPLLRKGAHQRSQLVLRHGKLFENLADQFDEWKEALPTLRPAQLLQKVLHESGLAAFYADDPRRSYHLDKLVHVFGTRDEPYLHPDTALRSLIEYTALARNVDYLSETGNQAVIVTIHQAKGLEFDTVFIAGASEGEIPHYYSQSAAQLEEERRLFYVAITRAKRELSISGYRTNVRGYSTALSSFVSYIDPRCLLRET